MKLLCVYDPAIIFPTGSGVADAREAFADHDRAQEFFGFKVLMTENMQLALYGAENGTPASGGGIFKILLEYLLYSPERDRRFIFVTPKDEEPMLTSTSRALQSHTADSDIAYLFNDICRLLLWSQRNHPTMVRYASGRGDGDKSSELQGDTQAEKIPILRTCWDWCESYKSKRKHPAKLLPHAFFRADDAKKVVWAFRPPKEFLEDEADLLREELPQAMIDARKWRKVGGSNRGFKDQWGNYWMWNQRRAHWDVQITESTKNVVGATDYHLNVEVSDSGRIYEGFQPSQESLMKLSIWED